MIPNCAFPYGLLSSFEHCIPHLSSLFLDSLSYETRCRLGSCWLTIGACESDFRWTSAQNVRRLLLRLEEQTTLIALPLHAPFICPFTFLDSVLTLSVASTSAVPFDEQFAIPIPPV